MQSESDNAPLKSLLCFCIYFFASIDFFVISFAPCFCPICLPFNLAVSIPSFVLWYLSRSLIYCSPMLSHMCLCWYAALSEIQALYPYYIFLIQTKVLVCIPAHSWYTIKDNGICCFVLIWQYPYTHIINALSFSIISNVHLFWYYHGTSYYCCQ